MRSHAAALLCALTVVAHAPAPPALALEPPTVLQALTLTPPAGALDVSAIAFDPVDDEFYVVWSGLSDIERYSTAGVSQGLINLPGITGTEAAGFGGIDIDFADGAFDFGGTTIPDNALLVFKSTNMWALDKTNGTVLAGPLSLVNLPGGSWTFNIVGGAVSNDRQTVYLTSNVGPEVLEHDVAASGALQTTVTGPVNHTPTQDVWDIANVFGAIDIATNGELYAVGGLSGFERTLRIVSPFGDFRRDLTLPGSISANFRGIAVSPTSAETVWIADDGSAGSDGSITEVSLAGGSPSVVTSCGLPAQVDPVALARESSSGNFFLIDVVAPNWEVQEYSAPPACALQNSFTLPLVPASGLTREVALDFVTEPVDLLGTVVPTGTLLILSEGQVDAVDPSNGTVLATVSYAFPVATPTTLSSVAYSALRDSLYFVGQGYVQERALFEVAPASGTVRQAALPLEDIPTIRVGATGDVEVDPATGNVYVVSDSTSGLSHRADVIRVFNADLEFQGDLSVDHVPFGVSEAISGLGFDDDTGDLWVSTQAGNVYQLPEPGVALGLAIGGAALWAARARRLGLR